MNAVALIAELGGDARDRLLDRWIAPRREERHAERDDVGAASRDRLAVRALAHHGKRIERAARRVVIDIPEELE